MYKVYDTRNKVPLYLWRIKPILKCYIVSLYYFSNCSWKLFLLLFIIITLSTLAYTNTNKDQLTNRNILSKKNVTRIKEEKKY